MRQWYHLISNGVEVPLTTEYWTLVGIDGLGCDYLSVEREESANIWQEPLGKYSVDTRMVSIKLMATAGRLDDVRSSLLAHLVPGWDVSLRDGDGYSLRCVVESVQVSPYKKNFSIEIGMAALAPFAEKKDTTSFFVNSNGDGPNKGNGWVNLYAPTYYPAPYELDLWFTDDAPVGAGWHLDIFRPGRPTPPLWIGPGNISLAISDNYGNFQPSHLYFKGTDFSLSRHFVFSQDRLMSSFDDWGRYLDGYETINPEYILLRDGSPGPLAPENYFAIQLLPFTILEGDSSKPIRITQWCRRPFLF